MRKLSRKERQILEFIGGRTVKKSETINQFESWYFRGFGADRYIGQILKNMCSKGFLVKPRHGYYKKKTTPNTPQVPTLF